MPVARAASTTSALPGLPHWDRRRKTSAQPSDPSSRLGPDHFFGPEPRGGLRGDRGTVSAPLPTIAADKQRGPTVGQSSSTPT